MSTMPVRALARKNDQADHLLESLLLEKTGLRSLPEAFIDEAHKLAGNLGSIYSNFRGRAFAFCATSAGEGVTTVCGAMAIAMQRHSACKILYIDANPISPSPFSHDSPLGLSELVLGTCGMQDALQEFGPISFLGTGNSVQEAAAQASQDHIVAAIKCLREGFDLIILDAAPPLLSPFASRIAREFDGLVLVVEAHKTMRDQVDQTIAALRRSDVPLLGIVYNRRRFQT